MTDLARRELLTWIGATAGASLFTWTNEDVARAAERVRAARAQTPAASRYTPKYFTAAEFATLVALSDLIIPKDASSGSASDAGAPEFIDVIVAEQPDRQTAMRGGLAWLDAECRRRFDKAFLACAEAERRQVLDDIAWPRRARPEMAHGVRFFSTLRDLVAAGFFSSKIGVADLGYLGNRPTVWNGPPAEVLAKLGLT
jgi:gluconate 2-dehydrogenase subunit 3-like protein